MFPSLVPKERERITYILVRTVGMLYLVLKQTKVSVGM